MIRNVKCITMVGKEFYLWKKIGIFITKNNTRLFIFLPFDVNMGWNVITDKGIFEGRYFVDVILII